jgi:hypothetical protein
MKNKFYLITIVITTLVCAMSWTLSLALFLDKNYYLVPLNVLISSFITSHWYNLTKIQIKEMKNDTNL